MLKDLNASKIICKMHEKLNKVIEKNDFDLLCDEVLKYSKRLDRIIAIYQKRKWKNIKRDNSEGVKEIEYLYLIKSR